VRQKKKNPLALSRVTVTLPAKLADAAQTKADREHAGNLSAVMRVALVKEVKEHHEQPR
jgi:hypothetical protein